MVIITKVMEQVYILKDRTECYANLVVGKEAALLFDTGSGVDSMPEAVRTVTKLPLLVIASHGHFDHIGGSFQFEKVYLSKEDMPILECYDEALLNEWMREIDPEGNTGPIDFGTGEWKQIRALDVTSFDLGNMECRVVPLPGHTRGSVGIHIPCLKLLLSGDALTPVMCLIFQNHLSKEAQYETLKRVQTLDFDYYLTSHHDQIFPKSMLDRLIGCMERSGHRKHYAYQYPRPPYAKGWFYLDSMDGEPVGLVTEEI